MKVAIITRDSPHQHGGLSTLTNYFAASLRELGIHVNVFHGGNNAKTLLSPIRLDLDRYDIVHLTSPPYGALVNKKPMVVTVAQPALAELQYYPLIDKIKALAAYPLESITLRKACSVVALSEVGKKDLMNGYPVEAEKIVTIPAGVDLEKFRPQPHNTRNVKILLCSRLEPRKNVREALVALASLGQIQLDITVIGDGIQKMELKNIAKSLRLPVAFKHNLPEDKLSTYFNNADVFITCSLAEGFGLSLLQAMASGCAIIASNIPAHNSLIKHETSGLIYRGRDDLRMRLESLLANHSAIEKFGEEARKVAQKYNWRTIGKRYLKLYKTLLEGHN